MKLNFWPFNKKDSPTISVTRTLISCPNCGSTEWISGPEGGGSQNLQCSKCYKYYNYMGPFGLHEIGDRSDVWGIKPPKI